MFTMEWLDGDGERLVEGEQLGEAGEQLDGGVLYGLR